MECTISTTLSGHRRGFVKRSLPDSGATISILGLQVANKINLNIDNTKVRLTNASGKKMSVEGETQLFLSVPGGAIKQVKAVLLRLVGKEFLIGWKDQVTWKFCMRTGQTYQDTRMK